ncbi:TraX family protein [Paenibacillus elgii]|uniref:TraX family protein n=1 Tax=Paenibacillus elgii TaxID=189691 RepID=UPI0013D1A8E1
MLKIIAYFVMLIDHLGQVFFPGDIIFKIVGRLALPLFAYGIAVGYTKTNNFRLYCLRLLLLSIISQIPYYLLFQNDFLNVCFTLLSGLLILRLIDAKVHIVLKVLFILGICVICDLFKFEYGLYGIGTILIFSRSKNIYFSLILQAGLIMVCTILYRFDPLQFVALFSVFVIYIFKNNSIGFNRILQYSFYPIHIILLLFLKEGIPHLDKSDILKAMGFH